MQVTMMLERLDADDVDVVVNGVVDVDADNAEGDNVPAGNAHEVIDLCSDSESEQDPAAEGILS